MPEVAITAVKSLSADGSRIGGYLVVWGNAKQRDLQGEYFTPETDLGLEWYEQRPVLYHHGLDGSMKASVIGVIDTLKADDTGLWAEAQLDLRQRYVRTVQNLVERGILGWSSGSLPHLVEVESDGRIKCWPIVEGSLTPAPAEPRRTDVHTLKSAYSTLGLDISRLQLPAENEPDATAKEPLAKEQDAPLSPSSDLAIKSDIQEYPVMDKALIILLIKAVLERTGSTMTDEEISALADQLVANVPQPEAAAVATEEGMQKTLAQAAPIVAKAVSEFFDAKQKTEASRQAAAKAAVNNVAINDVPASRAGGFSSPGHSNGSNPQITNMRTPYADMSSEDMSYYVMMRNAVRAKGKLAPWQPESAFIRELAAKTDKDYVEGKIRFEDENQTRAALKSINFLKANELDYSTQAGFGDEWVPDLWSSQLWEKARLDNVILPLFKTVEMPSNPYEWPIEGADPTVYYVPETTNENQLALNDANNPTPDSKVGSGKVTFNAKKLSLRVGISAELVEDSIIGVAAQYRKQAIRAIEDAIDNVLLNGDTDATASTNINLIDGTPAATAKYLSMNGLRKLWIITTAANGVDGGSAAVTLAQLRSARFSLDRAYSAKPDDLVVITHSEAYAKLLGLSEFITMDKAGALATAMTGQIGFVDGMRVLVSNEYALTNAAGKIPAAGGTLGSYTVAYRPGWYVDYRRRISASMDFIPYFDSYQLSATVRLAFVNRDAEVAAGVYNSLV